MDASASEAVWWGEEETINNERADVSGLKEKADHIEKCIDAFLHGTSRLPLGLVAEWSQRASYAKRKVAEATGESLAEHKRQIKTAEERRAQADRRRIVRDACARCSLPFGRSQTRRILWRLEVRSAAAADEKEEDEEEAEGVDQRLVAVCEGCEQVHMVGRMPRLRGEKRERREEEEEEAEWDTKSIGGASTVTSSSVFGSEKKRKGSASSLCSTPSHLSSSISSASPLVVSAAAKKSAKKKRGSELSRLLREKETEKKEETGGGLAAFLASLS